MIKVTPENKEKCREIYIEACNCINALSHMGYDTSKLIAPTVMLHIEAITKTEGNDYDPRTVEQLNKNFDEDAIASEIQSVIWGIWTSVHYRD